MVETWDPAFSLALENETTCDRPWLGEIRAAVIRAPGRAWDYAKAEIVRTPASCWVFGYPPALVSFRLFLPEDAFLNILPEDAFLNTLMYIPLGVLFDLMRGRGGFALRRGRPLIVGVSLTFEFAQLFVATRFTSIDDVMYNAVGGGLGLALALLLARRA